MVMASVDRGGLGVTVTALVDGLGAASVDLIALGGRLGWCILLCCVHRLCFPVVVPIYAKWATLICLPGWQLKHTYAL